MRSFGFVGASVAASLVVSALIPAVGSAHIDMLTPFKSRTHPQNFAESLIDKTQKEVPCDSTEWGKDPSRIYTFQPGATITIGVHESVGHPGYFRIAFDKDG